MYHSPKRTSTGGEDGRGTAVTGPYSGSTTLQKRRCFQALLTEKKMTELKKKQKKDIANDEIGQIYSNAGGIG